jgi:hypothetical protein
MPEPDTLINATLHIQQAGQKLSVEQLSRDGVSWEMLERTIIIEFGNSDCQFEALDPNGYIIEGIWHEMPDVPAALK